MQVIICETYEQFSKVAGTVAGTLHAKPNAVPGPPTGSTPLALYKVLIRMHRDEGLDFSQVTTFNLDEYVGLPNSHPRSCRHFMDDWFRARLPGAPSGG